MATITVTRDVRAWLIRRSASLMLVVTTAGMTAGAVARLAGASGAADAAWLAAAACGLAYSFLIAAASVARGRLSVDVIALLALAGAIAVDELLAAAVISVMLASGRALEAWAANRARHDLSALLARAPRAGRRYRDGSVEAYRWTRSGPVTCCSSRQATSSPWTARWPRGLPCLTNPR